MRVLVAQLCEDLPTGLYTWTGELNGGNSLRSAGWWDDQMMGGWTAHIVSTSTVQSTNYDWGDLSSKMPGLLEADKWRTYSRLDAFGELGQDQVQAPFLSGPAYQQESGERAISGSFEEHLCPWG